MLSYQHAFHAGNHADVIKHLCWLGVLNHLNKKAKPYSVIDTHAGSGIYPLDSGYAQKNQEFLSGISIVANHQGQSALLKEYQALCVPYWNSHRYPGSPVISAELARHDDHLHFMELHPTAVAQLQEYMRPSQFAAQLHVHHRDGLEGAVALSPPATKRGAVLVDPPYERKAEYQEVVQALGKLYQRWQNAQTVVWYPLLSARAGEKSGASESMVQRLSTLGKTCFVAELRVAEKGLDTGMYGSGVCVINPAWQLDTELEAALQEVVSWMGASANAQIRWLKTEQS